MDPSIFADTDWADFSSTYDEFRVVGVRMTAVNHQFGTAVNGGPIVVAFDNDSAANPGSKSQALSYSTSVIVPAVWYDRPVSFTWWRPTAGKETPQLWTDVANPSGSLGSIQFYASGLSASTQYTDLVYEFFCEFRGRR